MRLRHRHDKLMIIIIMMTELRPRPFALRRRGTMDVSSSQQSRAQHKEALGKLNSQLTCAVCFDRYTQPKMLPCQHVYCKECIDRIIPAFRMRNVVNCPSCRKPAHLNERGASALPAAFHINDLLEIDALLKSDEVPLCHKHKRPKDLYCETCEEHICVKCTTRSHRRHKYDQPEYLFTKHKQQIEARLQPVKERIQEVEQKLANFDNREKEMRDQEEAVQKEINATYQRLLDELRESRNRLSQQASSGLQEKLKLHFFQRTNVEAVLVKLKNCHEIVEEELKCRTQYQILEANKRLVEHICKMLSKVNMNELQPVQKPNISFSRNKVSSIGVDHIGEITSKQSFSFPGLFTVDIPQVRDELVTVMHVILTAHCVVPSVKRLQCCLDCFPCPITKTKVEDKFIITVKNRGTLSITVDEQEIYGSPFTVKGFVSIGKVVSNLYKCIFCFVFFLIFALFIFSLFLVTGPVYVFLLLSCMFFFILFFGRALY